MRIDIKQPERFAAVFKTVTGISLHGPISGIATDSRECKEGDLYIALTGERTDGHGFLPAVMEQGAAAALVSKINKELNLQQIKVENPQFSIGKIAREWRRQFEIPVIGITGSNGKTSTKELLVHVLSTKYNVHATEGNFNTHVGLPLTLFQLENDHTISILEMGANQSGDIEYLCGIAQPTHGLITNIAPAHLAGFGTIDVITETKGALFNALKDGTAFVNMADERVASIPVSGEKLTFGLTPDCDFPADIHHEKDGSLTLTVDTHEIPIGSRNLSFVQNSIAVSAIAVSLAVDWENVISQINSFSPPKGRCQVKKFDTITVIDDTYNANLSSCLAALDYLKAFSGNGRRIFVFGDMFELGDSSADQHMKVGYKCTEIELDQVFTIGNDTKYTDSVLNGNIKSAHFETPAGLIAALKNSLRTGDKVLFKGSRGMAMEKIIEGVFLN